MLMLTIMLPILDGALIYLFNLLEKMLCFQHLTKFFIKKGTEKRNKESGKG